MEVMPPMLAIRKPLTQLEPDQHTARVMELQEPVLTCIHAGHPALCHLPEEAEVVMDPPEVQLPEATPMELPQLQAQPVPTAEGMAQCIKTRIFAA
jgi:hypothetical protein